jgi:hypothetical protein
MEGSHHRVPRILTSNQKGAIAEAAITWQAIKLGIDVYRPVAEGGRFDLIFGIGNELLRVQCKWATRVADVVRVWMRTSRYTPRGYVHTTYSSDEIDAIAAYCPELDRCYFIPASMVSGQTNLHLRLAPARNGQTAGVKWAAEYELGAIAQLGERRAGSAKVAGSSPASST